MAKTKKEVPKSLRRPPARTPEARERQLIQRAVDLAEEQMINGTASAQVITHFLKLGTTRAALETEKLKRENELLRAKTENLESMKHVEELYQEAIKAMRSYSGLESQEDEEL